MTYLWLEDKKLLPWDGGKLGFVYGFVYVLRIGGACDSLVMKQYIGITYSTNTTN